MLVALKLDKQMKSAAGYIRIIVAMNPDLETLINDSKKISKSIVQKHSCKSLEFCL